MLQGRFDASDTEPPDAEQQRGGREWQLPVSYLQPPAIARMQAAGQVSYCLPLTNTKSADVSMKRMRLQCPGPGSKM